MPSLDLGIFSWILPVVGIVLFIYTIRKIGKVVPQITIQSNVPERLVEIAERQRDNPTTHLIVRDRIYFEFKRDVIRPYLWVRIFYNNLGVHDLLVGRPEGFAYYDGEQLPDKIELEEGQNNVPANDGNGEIDFKIYIPKGFVEKVSKETDFGTREIRKLQLHNVSTKVYVQGDTTRFVKWTLGGDRLIFRPNR